MIATAPVRKFVPKNLDVAKWEEVEPLFLKLIDRPINSTTDLEKWIADLSELSSVVDEYGSRRYIDKSCHTDDKEIEARFLHFVENIDPRTKPLYFKLQKKFLESPHLKDLKDPRYAMIARKWRPDVELFREENVPLETEVTKTVNEYDKLCGLMMVNFRGKELTLQQMARFMEEPDRQTRKEAFELVANRRLQDRAKIDDIFDQLLELRSKIAANAEMSDFRAYMFKALKRFDYTPDDCLRFADSIAEVCMPLVHELDRQRKKDLGLEQLRPWDMAVDPKSRPPLRPFQEDQIDQWVNNTKKVFERLSPELAAQFETLRTNKNLDLDSRKGKQPGGYQSNLEEVKQPFIFMNAAGVQRDVETLLHEGGHAFHSLEAADEPLVFLRSAPMEFCEVASMSMELLGCEHFDVFYDARDAARAKRSMLEGIVRFLPAMAIIDSFQHWIYTNPGHSRAQRQGQWLSLLDRFASKTDWSGYEAVREALWQRQLHLFHVPFYYVEYGIAQLGSLQLWMKSKQDVRRAVANYRAGLKLGGTKSLPELFSTAGIRFDFSQQTLKPLMNAIGEELARLPS